MRQRVGGSDFGGVGANRQTHSRSSMLRHQDRAETDGPRCAEHPDFVEIPETYYHDLKPTYSRHRNRAQGRAT